MVENLEIWAKTDFMGRNIIYQDESYKISINSFLKPKVVNLFKTSFPSEKKVGELVLFEKYHNNKQYLIIKYVTLDISTDNENYNYYYSRMINSVLSILPKNIDGILINFDDRINKKEIVNLFSELGGYNNNFGYLQIKNPKLNN